MTTWTFSTYDITPNRDFTAQNTAGKERVVPDNDMQPVHITLVKVPINATHVYMLTIWRP